MTREEAIQAPTDGDLIRREDAIEAIQTAYCTPCKERGDDYNEVRCRACDYDNAIMQIDALPSAEAEQVTGKLNKRDNSLLTDDSEECKEQKSKLDLISRQDAIDALGEEPPVWYDGEDEIAERNQWRRDKAAIESLPSAEPKTDEENELKFYYVESIDDYWIGRRLDNFYYADWHDGLGFVWSKSRYLPWGEHIVDENTLWKEHTYPSEPIEVPFAEWIAGFVKKYFAEPKTGEWMRLEREENVYDLHGVPTWGVNYMCDKCGFITTAIQDHFGQYKWCPSCGADMRGEDE